MDVGNNSKNSRKKYEKMCKIDFIHEKYYEKSLKIEKNLAEMGEKWNNMQKKLSRRKKRGNCAENRSKITKIMAKKLKIDEQNKKKSLKSIEKQEKIW